MHVYLLKRLITLISTLFGVSIFIFLLVHLIPGDPAHYILGEFPTPEAIKQLNAKLGLDQPLFVQYLHYINGLFHGNLGASLITGQSVWSLIADRFPITLQLAVYSTVVATIIGVLAGVIASVKPNSWLDRWIVLASLVGLSAPTFWVALLFIYVFSYKLSLFPISGYNGFQSLVLPSIVLGLAEAATIARVARTSMLDVLQQEYMRTAVAKGVHWYARIFQHALKNAMIPVVTLLGLQFGSLLAGAVVAEVIFSLKGIGNLMIDAISKRDIPIIQGLVFFVALMFAVTNLLVDFIYRVFDPRINYE